MNRMGSGKKWFACVVLAVGGCEALPDFLVDAGRDAAKEALEEAVEEAVEEVFGGVVGSFRNSIDGLRPLEADDEAGRGANGRR